MNHGYMAVRAEAAHMVFVGRPDSGGMIAWLPPGGLDRTHRPYALRLFTDPPQRP